MHRGMINSISLQIFSYRKSYHKLEAMEILGDMFSSPEVQQYMQVHHLWPQIDLRTASSVHMLDQLQMACSRNAQTHSGLQLLNAMCSGCI